VDSSSHGKARKGKGNLGKLGSQRRARWPDILTEMGLAVPPESSGIRELEKKEVS